MSPQTGTRNSTADRALEILGLFTADSPLHSAADIGRLLHLSRATAYRYLQSLVAHQFLEDTGEGTFRLGVRVLELARVAREGFGVSRLALPEMRRLADDFQQTVLLTRLGGHSIHCVEREEWHGQFLRLSYDPGVELPINAGASALVNLAWLPEESARALLQRPLRRFTTHTLVDPEAIIRRLREIRRAGYVITEAHVDADTVGIAAPIHGPQDDVVAGLSIVAVGSRFPAAERERAASALRAAASRIARRLAIAQ
ncbi:MULTISPECIES: IclR family transcriptional regulator [Microbacterium]|jgi:DNA-binding IclR family transcriptional regulator|uniref:IclR family transcriptional regulator n=1 Tax=Microbacterium TaxID=33882 RepID=UPI001D1732FE|nr:IclR family transcriptional regulator [Microbacterium testaceum]MCC4250357.1 IclR family transcriptional regulator [Microbacterium testaceum]